MSKAEISRLCVGVDLHKTQFTVCAVNEDGEYLLFGKITDEDKNCIIIGEYCAWMEKFGIWQERLDIGTRELNSDFYEYESVKAWMPLPQPYKAERR